MTIMDKYKVTNDYMRIRTKSPGRRPGIKRKGTVFIVAHDTGNDGSTARNNVDYFKRTFDDVSTSAHTFIDDKDIINCVPINEIAYHVMYNKPYDNRLYGHESNDYAIGVELCYGTKWTKERNIAAYNKYVWFIAKCMTDFGINDVKYIAGHHQLDPQRRSDPLNALKNVGKTWQQFLADVNKEYREVVEVDEFDNSVRWFSDVTESHWAYDAIDKVRSAEIIMGTSETEYNPDRPVTRAELAVVVARMLKL